MIIIIIIPSAKEIKLRSIHPDCHFTVLEPTTKVPNSGLSDHTIPQFVLNPNSFSAKTTKTIATTLMTNTPPKTDK